MTLDTAADTSRFRRVLSWLCDEPLLLALALLTLALALFDPQPWTRWQHWLNMPTLASLLALLTVAQGIRDSGYVQRLAQGMLVHVQSRRMLVLWLMGLSALLAMWLTNDVSLFLILPLTLALCDMTELPRTRLVVLVALAVNAGAALSPIGNPQNLLLWRHAGVNMARFMLAMLPAVAVMFACLVVAVWMLVPRGRLQALTAPPQRTPARPLLGSVSLALLVVLVALLQLGLELPALAMVMIVYALCWRGVLRRVDWALMVIFVLMLLGFGHLAELAPVHHALALLDWSDARTTLAGGVLLSQVISNVPATIALLHQNTAPLLLAVAVNVGGAGLFIGSLANLIALRLEGSRRVWRTFHLISIPYLLAVAVLVWLLLQLWMPGLNFTGS